MSTKSSQLDVVYDFLQITRKLDRDELAGLIHDSFEFRQLPSTFAKVLGNDKPKGKEAFLDMAVGILQKYFKSFQYNMHDINESPGKVWLHATSDAEMHNGETYKGEYVFMFSLTSGDGPPKITSCMEFVDSEASLNAYKKSVDTTSGA